MRALTCTVEQRTFLTRSNWSLGLPEQHANRTARLEARIAPEALAVARTQQGLGLGGVLLADALKRSAGAEMGVFAMVVDAENEAAQRFYEHHGFTLLPGASRRLFLPIDTALRRLASR